MIIVLIVYEQQFGRLSVFGTDLNSNGRGLGHLGPNIFISSYQQLGIGTHCKWRALERVARVLIV